MKSKKSLSLLFNAVFLLSKIHGEGPVQHDAPDARVTQPLLKGKLEHSTGLSLTLYYTDDHHEEVHISLPLTDGAFSISDTLITAPQAVCLIMSRELYFCNLHIALAPGYTIILQADAISVDSIRQRIRWGGRGSAVNQFYTVIDNHNPYYDERADDHNLKQAGFGEKHARFDNWYLHSAAVGDSLFRYYSGKYDADALQEQDSTAMLFKNVIKEEMLFRRLDILMTHANRMLDEMPAPDVDKYIGDRFDPAILKNISDSQYLAGFSYQNLMTISFSYLFYIYKYDRKLRHDTVHDVYEGYLCKIASSFKGPVRDYVFYRFINVNLLAATNSYDRFHRRAELTKPFLRQIENKAYEHQLTRSIDEKEKELATLKKGDPAPLFSLPDRRGKLHALKDFTGQIVVLDFWASWCAPCRHETPYLKALSRKYEKDSRLRFLSIAVRDHKPGWIKALDEDKPDWLQLFDDTGKTATAYFTNSIPRFVIIDGQDQIINFEAPAPGDGDKLEVILRNELEKN